MSMRVELVDKDGNVKGTVTGEGEVKALGAAFEELHQRLAVATDTPLPPKRTRTTGKASAIKTLRSEHARQSKVAATHEMRAQEARDEAAQIAAAIAALEGVDHDGQAHAQEVSR